jgi:hypothetical protein
MYNPDMCHCYAEKIISLATKIHITIRRNAFRAKRK